MRTDCIKKASATDSPMELLTPAEATHRTATRAAAIYAGTTFVALAFLGASVRELNANAEYLGNSDPIQTSKQVINNEGEALDVIQPLVIETMSDDDFFPADKSRGFITEGGAK